MNRATTLEELREEIETDLRGLAHGQEVSGLLVKISLADAVNCIRLRFSRATLAYKETTA